jgi:hypothetical protein
MVLQNPVVSVGIRLSGLMNSNEKKQELRHSRNENESGVSNHTCPPPPVKRGVRAGLFIGGSLTVLL